MCASIAGTAVLDQWCAHNCRNGFCPTDRCACSGGDETGAPAQSAQPAPAQALGGAALSFAKAPETSPAPLAKVGAGCRSISRFNELVDSVADKWCA